MAPLEATTLRRATRVSTLVLAAAVLSWAVAQVVCAVSSSSSSSSDGGDDDGGGGPGYIVVETGFLVPNVLLSIVLLASSVAVAIKPGNGTI